MADITISLDEELLESARLYAQKRNTSIDELLCDLLERTAGRESKTWLDECFHLMDQVGGNSRGRKWNREDLYDV